MRRSATGVLLSAIVMVIMIGRHAYNSSRMPTHSTPMTAVSSAPAPAFTPLYDVPPFKLIDQDGKEFTDRDLSGRMWIFDFIFTNCAGPCPLMSSKIAELQKKISRAGVGFISVTVDPKRDTPQVLKEYAESFNADPARWKFLTGPKDQVEAFLRGINIGAAEENESITHSTYFLLVDQGGQVVKLHKLSDEKLVEHLVADANQLAERGR